MATSSSSPPPLLLAILLTVACQGLTCIHQAQQVKGHGDDFMNSTCIRYLYDYARSVAELVYCSTINARPFTVCENCVQAFINSSATYATMMKANEFDGSSCRDFFINSDRVQVVRQLNEAMSSIWDLSQCDNCFDKTVDEEGEVTYALANTTVTFNNLINETLSCIEQYTNGTLIEVDDVDRAGNFTVCNQCAADYVKLNNLYNTMDVSVNQLCMDTIDKMNLTRIIWSDRLKCVYHHNTAWIVIVSTIVIGCLPIAFYIAVYFQADRQEHCVVPQKRLISRHRASIGLTLA